MAYQIGRASRIAETLELVNEKGDIVYALPVELDADKVAMEFNRRYNAVLRAEQLARALPAAQNGEPILMTAEEANGANTAIEAFGEAVIGLFELVFGTEGAQTLLTFFDEKYFEMATQVVPFLTDVVMPATKTAAKAQQARLAANYKLAAAARRK